MSFASRLTGVLVLVMACVTAQARQPVAGAAEPKKDRYTVLRCGRLLPVPGSAPAGTADGVYRDAGLVIKNDAVFAVAPSYAQVDLSAAKRDGVEIVEIDLSDSFVMPGFIDCHVHLTLYFDESIRLRRVTESEAYTALQAIVYARQTLEAGFTTVRDLGSKGSPAFGLRDAINKGLVPGPRMLVAGEAVSITGGHGDDTLGYREDLFPPQGPEEGIADGESACMKAVRYQVKRGADCIKLTATGGVLSATASGLAQHFTDNELKAIVSTAHSLGRKVAAHAHGTDGINAAIRAGVDSIEHGTFQDDESIRLFKETGSYYVPTLLAPMTVMKNAEVPGFYLPMVAAKARQAGPKAMESFRKAHAAGVKIAFGTDSGVSPHGENGKEFALMVQGGMKPIEAIRAATVSAADLCGLSDKVGTLAPGKQADLVAVRGDPLSDAGVLEKVTFVMRAGQVYKNVAR